MVAAAVAGPAATAWAGAGGAGRQALVAPKHWRCIEIISDLHLHAGDRQTLHTWQAYLRRSQADAIIMLGDLFEVWIGDDAAGVDGFVEECAASLAAAAQSHALYFMHGNRDFLVGQPFLDSCGVCLLADPCTLVFGGQRRLLSHGDALCLGDTDYMRFRMQVRSRSWQDNFLATPLTERRAVARDLRNRSELRKSTQTEWFDVDAAEARRWLREHAATHLIHGHTHRPAEHELGDQMHRSVLSDWDATAQPPRAQVLQLCLTDGDGAVSMARQHVGLA